MIDVPVQVKDALRDGRLRKNYRFVVLNEDGTESEIGTIDNNNLVSESVSIDERMCSGDTLKFGLCEGSSLEFQYFGKPNITGKRVQAFVDVDYGEAEPYTIPMGFFDVKKCSRQASTGIIKATCYNKLMSDYLDAKANQLFISAFDNPNQTVLFKDIRSILLNDYEVQEDNGVPIEIDRATSGMGATHRIGSSTIRFRDGYIDSPMNYETYAGASSPPKNVYPFVTASESSATLNPNNVYKVKFNYDIEAMEQSYYNELKRLSTITFEVDDSFMQRFINPSTWPGYVPYLGWHTYFGVGVEKSGGQIEYYSSIAYANRLNNVVGSLSDLEKKTITGCTAIYFYIPGEFAVDSNANGGGYGIRTLFYGSQNYTYARTTKQYVWYAPDGSTTDYQWTLDGWNEVYKYEYSEADKVEVIPSEMGEFTLREIISASYETQCQYGQLDRETDLFSGVELNHSRLYPADSLYPATDLYPSGAAASGFRSMYSKLWADEGNVHKWRNLIITYKGLDENQQPKDFTLQRQVNADGTDDYNCSDNWLFRNLIWTSEQIAQYAEVMVAKMQPITWFPFEMWAAGLPYLETGDQIEIPLGEETYTSYILQRQLKGIQNLQDTYINGTLDIF